MATKSLAVRVVVEHYDDDGEEPSKVFDQRIVLSGYKAINPGRQVALAAAAADQVETVNTSIGVMVFATDEGKPFKLRLASGEALLSNLRLALLIGDDEDDAIHSTTVLLTGNGTNEAPLEIWNIEKP